MIYSNVRFHPLLIALSLLVGTGSGCPQTPETPETSDSGPSTSSGETTEGAATGSGETTGSGGATSADESSSGGEPLGPDLWACELAEDCPQLYYHVDPIDDGEGLECPARLIVSGAPGHFTALHDDGSVADYETWLLVEVEGTAIVQTRERKCDPRGPCTLQDVPWSSYSTVQRCTLGATDGLIDACEADAPECLWFPWFGHLEGCVDIEPPSCADLEALLGGA